VTTQLFPILVSNQSSNTVLIMYIRYGVNTRKGEYCNCFIVQSKKYRYQTVKQKEQSKLGGHNRSIKTPTSIAIRVSEVRNPPPTTTTER